MSCLPCSTIWYQAILCNVLQNIYEAGPSLIRLTNLTNCHWTSFLFSNKSVFKNLGQFERAIVPNPDIPSFWDGPTMDGFSISDMIGMITAWSPILGKTFTNNKIDCNSQQWEVPYAKISADRDLKTAEKNVFVMFHNERASCFGIQYFVAQTDISQFVLMCNYFKCAI